MTSDEMLDMVASVRGPAAEIRDLLDSLIYSMDSYEEDIKSGRSINMKDILGNVDTSVDDISVNFGELRAARDSLPFTLCFPPAETNVFDAAWYLLSRTGEIPAAKLHKLLYYAQAWSLVWDDREMFPEDFEAWAAGPVCPAVYAWHGQDVYSVSSSGIPDNVLSGNYLTSTQKETLDAVIRNYNSMKTSELVELTKTEDPWKHAREGYAPGQICNVVIPKGSMAWHYASLS